MEVVYNLTEKEIECIKKIIDFGGSYNYSSEYDSFRKEYDNELTELDKYEFIKYDANRYYITFDLTDLGQKIYTKYLD